jgi:hypothetical protein
MIRIKKEKETENLPPALGIGLSILPHALPHGTALSPFIKLLLDSNSLTPETRETKEKDKGLDIPAMMNFRSGWERWPRPKNWRKEVPISRCNW